MKLVRNYKPSTKPTHAAAILSTPSFPTGVYRPEDAPTCADGRKATVRVLDDLSRMQGFDAPSRPGRRLRFWGEPLGPYVFIDNMAVNMALVEAVQTVHGHCSWSRTVEPIAFSDGLREHIIFARRGRKVVALVAGADPLGRHR